MRRASIRAAVITGLVLLGAAFGAQATWACNEPYIVVSPSSAGPGDTVTWTLANVEPRAQYTVAFAGRFVDSGVAGATAPTGTYVVPDLGSGSRSLTFDMTVTHDESSPTHEQAGSYNGTSDGADFTYRAPSTTPQPAPEKPTTPATPAPPPPDSAAPAPSNPPLSTDPDETDERTSNRPAPAPPAHAPGAAEPAPVRPAPVPSAGAHADPGSTVRLGDGRPALAARAEAAAEHRSAIAVGPRAREAAKQRVLPSPHPERTVPPVRPIGDGVPAVVLVGLSLLLVVAAGGVAAWALLRRGSSSGGVLTAGPPHWIPPGLGLDTLPHDRLIEAELQELIAEERARQIAREAAAIHTRPG